MTHPIEYLHGDATRSRTAGPTILVHCCNDQGAWGRGFVLAVSRRWPQPAAAYRAWVYGRQPGGPPFAIRAVLFVSVTPTLWVANLIGQHGLRTAYQTPPIRYAAIEQGLTTVAAFAGEHHAAVQMPRIGCGLAGGAWNRIEPIIRRTLSAAGVAVTVYDLS